MPSDGERAREFTVWIDYDDASLRVWHVALQGFFLNDFGDPIPMFIGWLP